jgi:hypothetical protein
MFKRLSALQAELKAPKGQFNKFGNYNYRSCEDILEAVKPLLVKHNLALTVSDTIEQVSDRYYVKATATIHDPDSDKSIASTAYAREPLDVKGMSDSQITGAASSYARKYALNGLLLIDDTKDADSNEARNEADARAKRQQARKNPDAVEPKNEKITEKEVQVLISMCARAGKDVATIFPKGVENLTASQYVQATQTLQGWIQKKEGTN